MDDPFSGELGAAKLRLKRLKDKLSVRAVQRRGLGAERDDLAGQQPEGLDSERDGADGANAEVVSSLPLRKMIAKYLLDPATVIPLDSGKIQRAVRYYAQSSCRGYIMLWLQLTQNCATLPNLLDQ